MENYIERIDQLTERWLDGATTDAEERELQSLVEECGAALPARLEWLADTFEGYRALAEERNPQPVKRSQHAHRAPLITLKRIATWSLAAAAVVVAIIGFSIDHEPYCYVNGEAVTSESQAQLYAQQVLSNIQSDELSNEDILGTLFTFE